MFRPQRNISVKGSIRAIALLAFLVAGVMYIFHLRETTKELRLKQEWIDTCANPMNSIRHVMMPYTNERMGDNMKNSWFQMNPGSIRDHNKEYVEACTSIADAISTVEAHGRRNMLQSSIVSVPFLAKSAAMAAGLCLAQRGGYMTIHTDAMPPALKAMTKMYLGLGEEILRMSKKAAPVAENLYNSMVRKFLDETVKHLQL